MIFDSLGRTGVVYSGMSEERAYVTLLNEKGKYIVTFDPLDGSTIIDSNFSIGSIFAIFEKGEDGDITKLTGRNLAGAAVALYGSRTNILLYNSE